MSASVWCAVALLGGLGAVARALLTTSVSGRMPSVFPLGTFVVNVSGAFLLGLVAGLGVGGDVYRLAGVALLGSYSTFSTWMLEARQLEAKGKSWIALAYLGASAGVGLLAVVLGRSLGAGV